MLSDSIAERNNLAVLIAAGANSTQSDSAESAGEPKRQYFEDWSDEILDTIWNTFAEEQWTLRPQIL
jgi:hypothetical protein